MSKNSKASNCMGNQKQGQQAQQKKSDSFESSNKSTNQANNCR